MSDRDSHPTLARYAALRQGVPTEGWLDERQQPAGGGGAGLSADEAAVLAMMRSNPSLMKQLKDLAESN
jgi:hypothetical protein